MMTEQEKGSGMSSRGRNIKSIVEILEPGRDCIVKSFPEDFNIALGRDIDILTLDAEKLINKLAAHIPTNLQCEMTVHELNDSHWHLDVYDEEFLFRIDVYSSFPSYNRFSVRSELFREIVASSNWVVSNESFLVPVPTKIYAALIRYFEYVDSFWVGTNKTHHITWIMSELEVDEVEKLYWLAHGATSPRNNFEGSQGPKADLLGKITVLAAGAVQDSPRLLMATKSLLSLFPSVERYVIKKLSNG